MPAPETHDTPGQQVAEREVALLQGLVAIPSPSGQERPAVNYLRDRMHELGFKTAIDAAGNAVGILGEDADREIVLLGHIDTVPGEIPVQVEDGQLYGRGAVDAKGPLATFVCAAARARPERLRVVVIGAVGEEAESPGARYVAPRYTPNLAVIGEPGGWDSVVLGYKGSLGVTYALEQAAEHGATPHATAPQVAVDFWNRATAHAAEFNRGRERAFDTLDATLRSFTTAGDGLYDRVELRAGFRLPPDLDGKALAARLRDLAGADGAKATLTTGEPLPAFRAEKNTVLVRCFLDAIRAEGGRPRFKVKTGTADMNLVGPAWGCPIVAYGPGDSKLDHTPHEHIELDEYLRAVAVLAGVLRGLDDASAEGGR